MRSKIFWKQFAALFIFTAAGFIAAHSASRPAQQDSSASTAPSLDYEFFKARVEPIFLKRRPGHARCYACHGSGTGPQYLIPLSPGSTIWNEAQSRKIFENVSNLVNPGDPLNSRFLLHPLSPMAGGDTVVVHAGGRQFESKNDPDWQIMAAWASGKKAASSPSRR